MTCIIICGPTASGKSSIALELAKYINGCIINADSQQVLSALPLLTDQPIDLKSVPHRLYGFSENKLTSFQWCNLATAEIKSSIVKGIMPIIVGGTGFYIRNLLEGHATVPDTAQVVGMSNSEMINLLDHYDPNHKLHINDTYRLNRATSVLLQTKFPLSWWEKQPRIKFLPEKLNVVKVNIVPSKEYSLVKIKNRLNSLFPAVLDEVNSCIERNFDAVIGFNEIKSYLNGHSVLDTCKELMYYRTAQYAKRQRTWFRHQISFDITLTMPDLVQLIRELDPRLH